MTDESNLLALATNTISLNLPPRRLWHDTLG